MDVDARIIDTRVPKDPEALVLVLHGGASRRDSPRVSPTQLSVLRMIPVAQRVARAGRDRLAVVRLLNSVRGWDARHTPVDDVRWALERMRERLGELPTGLVGHSLGGRAALLAADQPGVQSVVALNPWVHPTDRADLTGRAALVVHGTQDRIADPGRSEALVRQVGDAGSLGYLRVNGAKHAMLRHRAVFESAAADFLTATLLGDRVGEPVASLLGGEPVVTV